VQRLGALFALFILLTGGLTGKADAHLVSGFNIRVVHFEHKAAGTTGYFRISLPLLVANELGKMGTDQRFENPAPYTFNRVESGRVFHYVDANAVRRDTSGLGRLVADGHRLMVAGRVIQPSVLSVRVHPKGFVPPFNTLGQVHAAMRGPVYPAAAPDTDVAHVLVDAELFYPQVQRTTQFQFSSLLTPGTIGEPDTNNMLFDHQDNTVVPYAVAGLLTLPVTINPSFSEAFRQFLDAGILHILEGSDHLLFIVCLVIGDFRFRAIALRITCFSIGHSLSLVAGFYGWIPMGTWFPPLIEIAIALSILFAAMLVLLEKHCNKLTLPLTTMVGLVHGFGFAVGLREMLAVSTVNGIPSLISFNLGVEVGQLLVAGSCWSILYLIKRARACWFSILRKSLAAASTVISVFWVAQRIALTQ
jgi:hydrogenase/urease accessory protein HupE